MESSSCEYLMTPQTYATLQDHYQRCVQAEQYATAEKDHATQDRGTFREDTAFDHKLTASQVTAKRVEIQRQVEGAVIMSQPEQNAVVEIGHRVFVHLLDDEDIAALAESSGTTPSQLVCSIHVLSPIDALYLPNSSFRDGTEMITSSDSLIGQALLGARRGAMSFYGPGDSFRIEVLDTEDAIESSLFVQNPGNLHPGEVISPFVQEP